MTTIRTLPIGDEADIRWLGKVNRGVLRKISRLKISQSIKFFRWCNNKVFVECLVCFVRSLLYQSTLAFSYVARRLPIKKLQCIHTTKRLCITMDSVYELVGLWMTIQTLAWHLNSLDGIGIVADAKVKVLTYIV